MLLDISIIALTLLIILFPKLEDWRDKRYKSTWNGIKSKGKVLFSLVIILFILQICQLIRSTQQKHELDRLSANLDTAIERDRPIFRIVKKKLKWIEDDKNEPVIQLCLQNRGCRAGTAEEVKIDLFYVHDNNIYYEIKGKDHTGIYIELVSNKIESETCCLELNYGSNEYPEIIIEVFIKYRDEITNKIYKSKEQFYWNKEENNGEFQFGLKSKYRNMLEEYKKKRTGV